MRMPWLEQETNKYDMKDLEFRGLDKSYYEYYNQQAAE
jgi:hypothetical protein